MLLTLLQSLFVACRSIQDAEVQQRHIGTPERIPILCEAVLVECCFAHDYGTINRAVVKRYQKGK
jgi:hypothetical protein